MHVFATGSSKFFSFSTSVHHVKHVRYCCGVVAVLQRLQTRLPSQPSMRSPVVQARASLTWSKFARGFIESFAKEETEEAQNKYDKTTQANKVATRSPSLISPVIVTLCKTNLMLCWNITTSSEP